MATEGNGCRTLRVEFTSGREVLGSYWGVLIGGGLTLDVPDHLLVAEAPLCGGEQLRLQIHVLSLKKTYELDVRVLEVRPGPGGRPQALVSFLPTTMPDDLLDAAWADGTDAPQRRSRRLPLQTPVRYDRLDGKFMESRLGQLVNLSLGGCCVEGTALPPPGTQVLLTTEPRDVSEGPPLRLVGRVRWTERPGSMGVEFLRPAPELREFLRSLGVRITDHGK